MSLEIGRRLVELFNAGEFNTIYRDLYSPEIVSIEADPSVPECVGIAAVHEKNAWLDANFTVNGMRAEGPFPNGDEFAVIYDLDMTEKATGERRQTREVGIYSLRAGRIVREKFFYA
jgi:hypothetical protein